MILKQQRKESPMLARRWPAAIFILTVAVLLVNPNQRVQADQGKNRQLYFHHMALVPFLVGRHEPDVDESVDNTLSCPIGQICMDDPTILPEAGRSLTRLIQQQLQLRFDDHVLPMATVRDDYSQLALNGQKDTPRTLSRKMGRLVNADLIVIGTVWRYRERGAIEGVPDSPASVAFAIYLIDTATGRQLWRGIYDGTQETVLGNLFKAKERLKMGLKWLSADELARHGVDEVMESFPDWVLPDGVPGSR
jgi:hypothetical protein